jgi:hypothetical protein
MAVLPVIYFSSLHFISERKRLLPSIFDPVAGGNTFRQNVDNYLQNYTASYTKRP